MCLCCGGRMCMLCTCLVIVVIVIGFVFGFGIYKDGFHKLKDTFHESHVTTINGRPFLGFPPPPPPF